MWAIDFDPFLSWERERELFGLYRWCRGSKWIPWDGRWVIAWNRIIGQLISNISRRIIYIFEHSTSHERVKSNIQLYLYRNVGYTLLLFRLIITVDEFNIFSVWIYFVFFFSFAFARNYFCINLECHVYILRAAAQLLCTLVYHDSILLSPQVSRNN